MIKHTQTIRRLLSKNCLSVFHHFVGLALKGLTKLLHLIQKPTSEKVAAEHIYQENYIILLINLSLNHSKVLWN